LALAISWY